MLFFLVFCVCMCFRISCLSILLSILVCGGSGWFCVWNVCFIRFVWFSSLWCVMMLVLIMVIILLISWLCGVFGVVGLGSVFCSSGWFGDELGLVKMLCIGVFFFVDCVCCVWMVGDSVVFVISVISMLVVICKWFKGVICVVKVVDWKVMMLLFILI